MKFSLEWLREYVALPETAAEVAARLTSVGLSVETTIETAEADGDAIFDVDVTTNRPDAMNHLGLARELAVAFDRPLRVPAAYGSGAEGGGVAAAVAVAIDAPDGCARYVARLVRGVRVGPSPEWLRRRLLAIGQRSINNVVDVTNFVLWECGQPLHAFDFATLGGTPKPEIRVRRARAGETLTTLDGQDRDLDPEILVIADASRPVALAGVMGGLATEVTEGTADVLLESAHFDPRAVRAGAKKLGMHTDASHRFERGADPEGCRAAADRAVALLVEVAGGSEVPGAVDARAADPAPRRWPPRGRLDHAALCRFLGAEVAEADVERWLSGLGFTLEREAGPTAWRVAAPSWRWYDFEPGPAGEVYPADFYEEVLRHFGFDRVPAALPELPGSDGPPTPAQRRRERIRRELAGYGFAETIGFAFHAREADSALPRLAPEPGTGVEAADAAPLALANPLSERYAVMRRSLVPNLLDAARFNRRRGAEAVRLFEIGRGFYDLAPATGPNGLPVAERELVALIAGGFVGTPWDRRREIDLFDVKGAVEGVAEAFATALSARPAELPGVVPGTGAWLYGEGAGEREAPVGWLGQIDDAEGDPVGLFAAELATDALAGAHGPRRVAAPSRFPGVSADLTLTHPLATPWAELAAAIESRRPADLAAFGLKDRYRGEGVPAGAVNTTMFFVYSSPERTLSQEEVNERQAALAAFLAARFGGSGGGGEGA